MTSVAEARNTLETARTDSAQGALIRATAGQEALTELINAQIDADPTRVTVNASITQIDGHDQIVVDVPADGKLVTLTVVNAQLDKVAANDIKIAIGSKEPRMDSVPNKKAEFTYEVKVLVPGRAPDAAREFLKYPTLGR